MVSLFYVFVPPAIAVQSPSKTVRIQKTLALGVYLVQEIQPIGAPGGPQTINIVRLSPAVVSGQLRAALGQDRVWGSDPTSGRETVSSLAQRTGALVAINAGFFPFKGNPIGLHVEGGELITEPSRERSSLVVDESGKASVISFRWNGSVTVADERRPLHGLNRQPGKGNELLAFTSKFFTKTLTAPDRLELMLEGSPSPLRPGAKFVATVKSVATGGDAVIEPDSFILSAGGAMAEWLREKAPVGVSIAVDLGVESVREGALAPQTIRSAVTGAGRLLTGGKVAIDLKAESIAESFSTTRHPRTAAGVCADGSVILVTIDGRQPSLSRGMSLLELAETLKRLGAIEAVNLDGGGSTAMAVRGDLVNSPSDAAERPVADMLVVDPPQVAPSSAELPGFSLAWPQLTLQTGNSFVYPKPTAVKESELLWSTQGNIGFVDQTGRFRALRAGTGKVRVRVGSRIAETEVRVESAPKSP